MSGVGGHCGRIPGKDEDSSSHGVPPVVAVEQTGDPQQHRSQAEVCSRSTAVDENHPDTVKVHAKTINVNISNCTGNCKLNVFCSKVDVN